MVHDKKNNALHLWTILAPFIPDIALSACLPPYPVPLSLRLSTLVPSSSATSSSLLFASPLWASFTPSHFSLSPFPCVHLKFSETFHLPISHLNSRSIIYHNLHRFALCLWLRSHFPNPIGSVYSRWTHDYMQIVCGGDDTAAHRIELGINWKLICTDPDKCHLSLWC